MKIFSRLFDQSCTPFKGLSVEIGERSVEVGALTVVLLNNHCALSFVIFWSWYLSLNTQIMTNGLHCSIWERGVLSPKAWLSLKTPSDCVKNTWRAHMAARQHSPQPAIVIKRMPRVHGVQKTINVMADCFALLKDLQPRSITTRWLMHRKCKKK